MRIRRSALALPAVVLLFACIPERDNVNDPSLALMGSLQVSPIDVGRSEPVVLDATGSQTRDGRTTGLRYRWDLDYREGDRLDSWDFETASVTTSVVLSLNAEEVSVLAAAGGVGTVTRTIRLIVADEAGHTGQATEGIAIHNSAPLASVGEDLYVSERVPFTVELDGCGGGSTCTTTDPEGDPITSWSWRRVAGPPVTAILDSNAQSARFVIDVETTSPYVFELTVSDGLASSSSLVRVYRDSQLWIGSVTPARLARVFPEAARVHEPDLGDGPGDIADTTDYYIHSMAVAGGGSLWIAHSGAGWQGQTGANAVANPKIVRVGRNQQPQGEWKFNAFTLDKPYEGVVSIASFNKGEGCAAVYEDDAAIWAWLLQGNVIQEIVFSTLDTLDRGARVVATTTTQAGTPACWTVDENGGIGVLTAVGQNPAQWTDLLPPATLYEWDLRGAVSDSSGNLWIAETDDLNTFFDPSDDKGRLRFVPQGMLEPPITAFTLPAPFPLKSIRFLAAAELDQVWVATRDEGLFLVDSAGTWTPYALQTDGVEWDPLEIGRIAADRAAHSLWVTRTSGTLHRFDVLNGTLAESGVMPIEDIYDFGGSAPFDLLLADEISGSAYVFVGGVASTEKVIARVPDHLQRFLPVPNDFDVAGRIFASPEGNAWILDPYRDGPLPVQRRGLVRISHTGRKIVDLPLLDASTMAVVGDGTIWTAEESSVVHRDADGLELYRFSTVAPPVDLSAEGGTLCVATRGVGTGAPLRVVGEGAPETLTTMVGGTSYTPVQALATANGDCWFVSKRSSDSGCCIGAQVDCTGEQFPRLLKYPAGSTSPIVSTLFDDDFIPGTRTGNDRDYPTCPLDIAPDPLDGGVWVVTYDYDTSRVTRFSASGTEETGSRIGGGYTYPVNNRLGFGATRIGVQQCPATAALGLDICRRVFLLSSVDVTVRDEKGDPGPTRWAFDAGQTALMDFVP